MLSGKKRWTEQNSIIFLFECDILLVGLRMIREQETCANHASLRRTVCSFQWFRYCLCHNTAESSTLYIDPIHLTYHLYVQYITIKPDKRFTYSNQIQRYKVSEHWTSSSTFSQLVKFILLSRLQYPIGSRWL